MKKISALKVNLISIPFLFIVVPMYFLFKGIHSEATLDKIIETIQILNTFERIMGVIILIVIHEIIHGITWSLVGGVKFSEMKFGVMWRRFMPYCHCPEPIHVNAYRIGALMPLLLMGIIPYLIALMSGSYIILLVSMLMTVAAIGDILIVWMTLGIPAKIKILDHPNEAGFFIYQ